MTSRCQREQTRTYENVVIRSPVRPKDAVHAGNRQLARFTTRMMAKQSQKASPMLPPTIPVLSVATAIFALNLDLSLASIFTEGNNTYQKVHAFQTLLEFC